MNRSVELTAIVRSVETQWLNDLRRAQQPTNFRNVEFNEDDLERETDDDEEEIVAPSAPLDTSNPPTGMTFPITVFENDLREYYGRRSDRAGMGTRLVYRSGQSRVVRESYEEVKAKFAALGDQGENSSGN
jgi:hypothetical protein